MPYPRDAAASLPRDADAALLVGRVWRPELGGPSVVVVRSGDVHDISAAAPTVRDLLEADDPVGIARHAAGERLGTVAEILANTPPDARDSAKPWLLAPIDQQAVKAAGVTFVISLLERVVEEQARGAPERAAEIRREIQALIGEDLARLKPGSAEAMALKSLLVQRKMWSQYLEVGIGPDAEIFTKMQPMSVAGSLVDIGIRADSTWNNPEPEVVLAVNSKGAILGATLGNDVNLRDFEGRSALLLSKAKDNVASGSLGPFIRLFDEKFGLDDVRRTELSLTVEGTDGYRLEGASLMEKIARDPADLVAAAIDENHQYPDGFVLYLGTLFAPIEDRDEPGQGFTHKVGDMVTIAADRLGALVNRVVHCEDAEPWTFGTGALMRNLARRGLI
jgi:fumarylacetoacetate (FAA) hydrolase family protein